MENLAHVLAFTRARCLGRKAKDIVTPTGACATGLETLWRDLELDGLDFELAACLLDCGLIHGPARTGRWLARCLRVESLLAGLAVPRARDGRLGARSHPLLERLILRPGLALRLAHGILSRRADHARRHSTELSGEAARVGTLRRVLAGGRPVSVAGPSAGSARAGFRPAGRGGCAHA